MKRMSDSQLEQMLSSVAAESISVPHYMEERICSVAFALPQKRGLMEVIGQRLSDLYDDVFGQADDMWFYNARLRMAGAALALVVSLYIGYSTTHVVGDEEDASAYTLASIDDWM